ncbi:hypothetical protein STEG23_008576, partial [Scotinomys teguina]
MQLELERRSPLLNCLFLLDIDFQVLIKFFNSEEYLYVQNSFLYIYQQQVIKVKSFRILTKLLEVSDDPQVLAVAAHDVGEYVRHYPRGKRVIEQLGGKQLVMNHMHHEDQQVRYNALLAVQKLMVHN